MATLSYQIRASSAKGVGDINSMILLVLFQLSTYFIAFLVFMLTIRFIRLLRINRKIGVLGDTLIHLQQPLTSFMVVFGATFLAFAMAMYILFGASLRKFRTFITTVETLLAMMLSKYYYQPELKINRNIC